MKNIFKKFVGAALALTVIFPLTSAFSANVGDKIGKVLSTDIVTYIEGVQVPSFNIAGRTAVIVENLNAMGLPFEVWYDDSTRTLSISEGSGGTRDYFHFSDNNSTAPIGTPIMDVLYTDIETFYQGKKLESFNIGGFTCVYATDLANLYGRYTFNESTRSVDIFRNKDEAEGMAFSKEASRKLPADESIIQKGDTTVRWGSPEKSYLIKNENGTYSAIEFSEQISVETYDADFNYLSSLKIKSDYPVFGGFLEGDEYNYIVTGQENLKENDSLTVINISVYDKNFRKIKDIPVKGCRTTVPFDACNVSMTENEDFLVLHTSRSQYKEKNGLIPQTGLTVIIDKKSWKVTNTLDKFQPNHTSHALKGFVRFDSGKIVTANYSDATPVRGAFIQEMDTSGKLLSSTDIFSVAGPASANCTGAMLGGFEVSSKSYITALSTIDHTLATDYGDTYIEGVAVEERDILIAVTNKNTKKTKTFPLTFYSGSGKTASVPYLVKLESGNFMVLWQRFETFSNTSNTFCYAFLDKNGSLIGEAMQYNGYLSGSCQPVETDGKVMWYTNTSSGRVFYEINSNPSAHILSK